MFRQPSGVAAIACVAAAAFAFQLPIFDRWFSVMDEGHMLLFADLVNQGQQLYRDATIYPLPGAFYLLALVFALFEPSILVSRWLLVVEFAAFVAIVFALARRALPLRWALGCAAGLLVYRIWAFPHWQMYSYSTTALLLLVASLAMVARFCTTGREPTLALAGLCFGLGVFCKQDYGAATMLAIAPVLVVHARFDRDARAMRSLAWFLGPAACVGLAAAIHFVWQGQLGFVVQMTVLKHFVGLSTYEYQAFPPLLPLFRQDPELRSIEGIYNFFPAIVYTVDWQATAASALYTDTAWVDTGIKTFIYGPVGLVGVGAVWAWRRRGDLAEDASRPRALTELLVVATAGAFVLLAHVYRPQDWVHTAVLYWPLVCLATLLAHEGWQRLHAVPRVGRVVVAGFLLLPVLATVAYTARLMTRFRAQNPVLLEGERGGVFTSGPQARLMDELVEYVRERSAPDEPIAVLPYFSLVHFLANRHGPHAASYIVWPFPEYPDRDQRIIDAMEAHATDSVIYNHSQFPNFPPVAEYAPDLYAYLVEHFETDRVFGAETSGFRIAGLRRSAEAPGRPIALDPAATARLRVERGASAHPVPDAERAGTVAATTWPFRRVLALRPTAGGRTTLAVPVSVAKGDRLRTAVGVHPDQWFGVPPSWVRFSIEAERGGQRYLLFTRTLDPQQVLADRGWFDVNVALDDYAGETIDLVFATETAWPQAQTLGMAGFAEPRVAPADASR